MGYYGITGWSGGGRRPINYGLKAGQFRTGKYNVFQNKTVINNNIFAGGYSGFNYGYYDQQCCGSGSSTPKWMNWMMGIGLGTSLLGGIFSLFGGEKTEGGGETPEAKPETDEFASAKTLYPDWRFAKEGDTYYAVKGETQLTGTSVNDLLGQIGQINDEDEETYYCYINQDEIDDIQEEHLVQKYLSDVNIGKMIARQRYEEYKLNK